MTKEFFIEIKHLIRDLFTVQRVIPLSSCRGAGDRQTGTVPKWLRAYSSSARCRKSKRHRPSMSF